MLKNIITAGELIQYSPQILKGAHSQPQGELWHGTGRYQYRNGQVVDILQEIADSGGLVPHHDTYDFAGETRSISLAYNREYARAYADMHGLGDKEPNRNIRASVIAARYMGSVAIAAALESRAYTHSGYRQIENHLKNNNVHRWNKTRVFAKSVLSLFRDGSDIEGNYPILFKVKGYVYPLTTSKAVALHEIRTDDTIPINKIEHVETSPSKIDEVQKLIGARTISIFDV